MSELITEVPAKLVAMMKKCAHGGGASAEALQAQADFVQTVAPVIRKANLVGSTVDDIFTKTVLGAGVTPHYELDLVAPGQEGRHTAFTIPKHGYIPENIVQSDYVTVPTYKIANSVDWLLDVVRDARWDMVARALEVMNAGVAQKINDDAWRTILATAADRDVLIFDEDSTAGVFTKRLVSLMQLEFRRQAGGNTGSLRRGRLTDLYVSPEALENVRNWGMDQLDEISRREIYIAESDGAPITRIFGVNLRDLDELGEGQAYQDYFLNELGGDLGNDKEIVIGLDLSDKTPFVMPVRQDWEMFPDPQLHRHQRGGVYGWMELGIACLDNRVVMLGSF